MGELRKKKISKKNKIFNPNNSKKKIESFLYSLIQKEIS